MIPFTCPHCGAQTTVEDRYAGQSGPCAVCGKRVTVPPPADRSSPREKRPPTSGRGRGLLAAALAAGGFALVAALLVMLGVVLWPAVEQARHRGMRRGMEAHLQQIAAALRSYEQMHGAFPPAHVADDNGRPMHSWRVLILPQLGQQDIYDLYDFTKPWDDPANQSLAAAIPEVYRSPYARNAAVLGETNVLAVTGPKAVLNNRPREFADIGDPLSQTLLVVESGAQGVQWLEPRDIDTSYGAGRVNDGSGRIGSVQPGGALVATVDGRVHLLRDDTPAGVIEALITIDGGDVVPADTLRE